jgi:hypothetical protein
MTDKHICSKCGKSCDILEISHGMETTEYWGCNESVEEIETVSDCCEDELIDDDNGCN